MRDLVLTLPHSMTGTISQASLRKIFPMGPKSFRKSPTTDHYLYSGTKPYFMLHSLLTLIAVLLYVTLTADTNYCTTLCYTHC